MSKVSGIGKTAIVCRPDQLLEAAIAVSCMNVGGVPPLLVLDPPPMMPEEFRSKYITYKKAERRSTEKSIGAEYRQTTNERGATEIREAVDAARIAHTELAETRSWLIRNQRYLQILTDAGCQTAVFLFSPGPNDLKVFYAFGEVEADIPTEKWELECEELIPKELKRVFVLPNSTRGTAKGAEVHRYENLHRLTEACWAALRPSETMPARVLAIGSANNPVDILQGLVDAFKLHIPLAVGPQKNRAEGDKAGVPARRPGEAVLVEASNAESIAGVLYGMHRKAPLFVIREPEGNEIEKALEDYNRGDAEARSAAAQQMSNPAAEVQRGAFSDAIKAWIFGDGKCAALGKIEGLVSAVVPEAVVKEVGSLPLTAFTKGTPYNFVRTAVNNWGKKPIGHVINDKSLVVLSEIMAENADVSDVSFAAIFDPGFFADHSETRDVEAAMTRHSSVPLLFSRDAASLATLIRISQGLPLDLLFVLSHGNEEALLLADVRILQHQIVQWLRFPTGPIIFNNSCLSWIGVGRELIRVGARGYVGTLWSVDSRDAAELARQSIVKIVSGEPVARAIRLTGVPLSTELAYIFVGTASSRVQRPPGSSLDNQQFRMEAASKLLDVITDGVSASSSSQSLDRYLYAIVSELLSHPELQERDLEGFYSLRLRQLQVLPGECTYFGVSHESALELADGCLQLIDSLDLKKDEADELRANAFYLRGRIESEFGNHLQADTDLKRAEQLTQQDDEEKLRTLIVRTETLKKTGDREKAIKVAMDARKLAEKLGNRKQLVVIIGELAQLMKRIGDYKRGQDFAKEGFQIAVEIRDWHQQVAFKADQAQLLMGTNRYNDALAVAREVGRIAREHQLEVDDLKAYGMQVVCNMRLGNLDEAYAGALQALQTAVRLGDRYEQGCFLRDLAEIDSSSGRMKLAIKRYGEAAEHLMSCGAFNLVANLYMRAMGAALALKSWKYILSISTAQLTSHSSMPWELRSLATEQLLHTLMEATRDIPGKERDNALGKLAGVCSALLQKEENADDIKVVQMSLLTLHYWLEGSPKAEKLAARLDELSGSDVPWREFVKHRPPR